MGQVYRATDTNLKRSVAIKVLPASMADDADRLARFQREAEVLAALSHPNIAAIYGLEKTPDVTALVMEFVEGEDLADRIARGPIPLDEALPIAKQIAEALEAAHDQGIIHRDLKPANIKVRSDGTVKVLDFGLAKAVAPEGARATDDAANSPTLTARATQMGMLLGTAAYMAPEQALGKVVDRRADIWAFGVVVYEMLTGARAFPGDDITDVLAAVVRAEPDWKCLPHDTPSSLRTCLARCLHKDPRRRLPPHRQRALRVGGSWQAWRRCTSSSITSGCPSCVVADHCGSVRADNGGPRICACPPAAHRAAGHSEHAAVAGGGSRRRAAAVCVVTRRAAMAVAASASGRNVLWVRPLNSLTAQPLAGTE